MFDTELDFFIRNQDDLVRQYANKVLVLIGEQIIGVYQTPLEAFLETAKTHTPGTFMLQRCIPGTDAYTITLSSTIIQI